jgi:hypothetical protein
MGMSTLHEEGTSTSVNRTLGIANSDYTTSINKEMQNFMTKECAL